MKDNIPPEEILLRLIRKEKTHPHAQETKAAPKNPPAALQPAQKAPLAHEPAFIPRVSLGALHRIIIGAFILSLFFLASTILYPWFGFKEITLPRPVSEGTPAGTQEKTQPLRPLESYTRAIQNKKIFGSIALKDSASSHVTVPAEVMKDINLVGIISGENPQAIIEDKKIQKTYYVTEGQSIADITLDEIFESKIILNYKGQRFELHL